MGCGRGPGLLGSLLHCRGHPVHGEQALPAVLRPRKARQHPQADQRARQAQEQAHRHLLHGDAWVHKHHGQVSGEGRHREGLHAELQPRVHRPGGHRARPSQAGHGADRRGEPGGRGQARGRVPEQHVRQCPRHQQDVVRQRGDHQALDQLLHHHQGLLLLHGERHGRPHPGSQQVRHHACRGSRREDRTKVSDSWVRLWRTLLPEGQPRAGWLRACPRRGAADSGRHRQVFEQKGMDVMGLDIFPTYVDAIKNKTLKSGEPRVTELLQKSTNFKATCDVDEALDFSDLYFIVVDTPCTGSRHYQQFYDHGKLGNILKLINERDGLRNKHIVISCTVMPGYTNPTGKFLVKDAIERGCTLSYNPEFIAQGDIVRGLLKPDMVLIGEGSQEAGDRLEDVYLNNMCDNVPVISRMSCDSAEITKLSINCFITTKISFCSMVSDMADRTPGANKFDIMRAVGADARIGQKCLMPGYGFGGPCFPRDNRALGGYARALGVEPLIPDATDRYNEIHSTNIAKLILGEVSGEAQGSARAMKSSSHLYAAGQKALQSQDTSAYCDLDLAKKRVVFSDVCYKPKCTVPIIEESQKLMVAFLVASELPEDFSVIIQDRPDILHEVQKKHGPLFKYEP